jgi:hypothetical protein
MAGNPLIEHLIANFEDCLSSFAKNPPFSRRDQLISHRKTVSLRKDSGSAAAALSSDKFLDSLAKTLKAWGVGIRGTALAETTKFRAQLRKHSKRLLRLMGKQSKRPTIAFSTGSGV